jgi:hypothetical protein
MIVRRRPMCWLTKPAITPPLYMPMSLKIELRSEGRIRYSALASHDKNDKLRGRGIALTQLPMIVAIVALCDVKFFVVCRYVGYKSYSWDVSR